MMQAKQAKFTHMIALLILHAEQLGYALTFGDAYRSPDVKHGIPKSFHRSRLAVDFNLFGPDGTYLTGTDDHLPLGIYWESIGGSWGGRWEDGNHYSLGEGTTA